MLDTPTYRRSDCLMQVIVRKTTNTKKGRAPVSTVFTHCVIDWAPSLLGDGFTASDGDTEIFVQPIWIGWSRDGGKTLITNEDLIEKYGLMKISDLAKEFPCLS